MSELRHEPRRLARRKGINCDSGAEQAEGVAAPLLGSTAVASDSIATTFWGAMRRRGRRCAQALCYLMMPLTLAVALPVFLLLVTGHRPRTIETLLAFRPHEWRPFLSVTAAAGVALGVWLAWRMFMSARRGDDKRNSG